MKLQEDCSATAEVLSQTEPGLFRKALPFEQYAILIPLELINTTAVLCPSETKGSIEITECFIPPEILRWESVASSEASAASEILHRYLESYFSLSSGEALWLIRLSLTSSGVILACKASDKANPRDLMEIVQDAIEVPGAFLDFFFQILSYERLIIRTVITNRLPCFLTNQSEQVIIANPAFKDLVDIPAIEPMTKLKHIISLGEQNHVLENVHEEQWMGVISVYCRNTNRVFESRVSISPLHTPIGKRFLWVFSDIPFSQVEAGSNTKLLERLTATAATAEEPEIALRRIINMIVTSFQADIVALFKECEPNTLVITPYSNRNPQSLGLTVLEFHNQSGIESYFPARRPLFYQADPSVTDPNIVKCKLDAQQYALIPVVSGKNNYALLVVWQSRIPGIDSRVLTTFKVISNIMGSTLAMLAIKTEAEKEKEKIQRYAKLTAGREIQMARLKKQIGELQSLLKKITADGKEQI
ncbi:MAG: hypothetical protein ACUVUU_01520 [bacterium]